MNFESFLRETQGVFAALAACENEIAAAAARISETLRRGNTIFTCGNGGSAAEAQHLATELTGRYRSPRPSLPAVALSADGALLTCIANDFGWEAVFRRQVEGLARPGDLLICFSTSGDSPNILAALDEARKRGIATLALLGKGGGTARGMADTEIIVPSRSTGAVQEAHLFLIHYFCEKVEGLAGPASN